MATTYKIENTGSRAVSFGARGGPEVVKPGATRTLELKDELTKERIEQLEEMGVKVGSSSGKPENAEPQTIGGAIADRRRPRIEPAKDPAETGGEVPRSRKSDAGGVARAAGDTTTTTKPTTDHVGPKA